MPEPTPTAGGDLARLVRETPNDPGVIQAVYRQLGETDAAPEAMRLLYELALNPALEGAGRGYVTALIVNVLRRDAALFDPKAVGLDPEHPAYKLVCKGLKAHLDSAFNEFDLARALRDGAMTSGDAPKFIVAIPKSGSSLLGICLGNMIKLSRGMDLDANAFMFRGYPAWWSLGNTHDWDLRPEIGADPLFQSYPGGVYKGHINPIEKNFEILRLYSQSRTLLVVRDPRDQIAASFCQQRRFSPDPGARASSGAEAHDAMLAHMRSGQLLENLIFVGKWLAHRDPARSLVVTFEQLTSEPERVLGQVSNHFGLGLSEDQIERVYTYSNPITDRVGGADKSGRDASIYPFGWTGERGVWTRYFSDEAGAFFNAALSAFRSSTPWSEGIDALYPELACAGAAAAG